VGGEAQRERNGEAERDSLLERLDEGVRNASDPEAGHQTALQLLSEARKAHSRDFLSDDELHEFVYWGQVAWLRLKWGSGEDAAICPFCQNNQWTLAPPVSLLSEEIGGIPEHFGVSCTNCGQMVLVSADAAGLVDEDDHDPGGSDE
jgi:hypothetical protein